MDSEPDCRRGEFGPALVLSEIGAADHRVGLGRLQAGSLLVVHLHAVQVGNQRRCGRDRAEFPVVDQHHVGVVDAVDELDCGGCDAGQGLLNIDGLRERGGQIFHC